MTPGETVYGSLKRYFSSRSGLIETWFAIDVEPAGVEAREDRVPLGLLELHLEAELVGDRLGDLDVVAGEVAAAVVVEAEGAVGALGRDGQRARLHQAVLVPGCVVARRGRAGRAGGEGEGGGGCGDEAEQGSGA